MAVDILVDGRTVDVDDEGVVIRRMLPTSYAVQEDATPTNPAESSGGFGTISFGITPYALASWLRKKPVEVRDGSQGFTTGFVTGITDSDTGGVSLTADSRLSLLNVERNVGPYVGTLGGAIMHYLSLCNITIGVIIDPTIAARTAVFPAFQGFVWDNLRQLFSVQQIEISLVSDNVVVRKLREREAVAYRDDDVKVSYDDQNTALSVEVYLYETAYKTNGLAYPVDINDYSEILPSVDAGQTITGTLEIEASLTSIQQPVCVDYVTDDYQASSVYSVAGNDGKGIEAAQWIAQGGSLVLEIDETTQVLKYTLTGATGKDYAPYQIAVTSGTSSYYNSLRVVGTGVFQKKEKYTSETGVDPDRTQQEVGVTVDIPFITTKAQLHNARLRARNKFSGGNQVFSVTTRGINRRGQTDSYEYPQISKFDDEWAGRSLSLFNADWLARAAHKIEDFNAEQYADVADNFINQAFGNVVGARRRFKDAYYRITSSTITRDQVRYSAERDTIVKDHNTAYAGMSIADWNDLWSPAGLTVEDHESRPLMKENPYG